VSTGEETTADHTSYVLEGLAYYRDAAEQSSGHTMESWQFEDSRTGHTMSARCSRCGWMFKLMIGNLFDLTTFPASARANAVEAVRSKCRRSVRAQTKDSKAS